ncbi:hypothetical protein G8759_31125 [Spirosoma aureum]|uniref:Uncharacterized protein n=1 Tax=Spirosoma aureum TaxID=2692134 RepID=A0A6G9AWQ3_9BACT|nr:hypothetical protein [Spirosoma aureum]QIP16776.1 hypothetical protein G8759_31125 [Spirosoma aureum]
MLHHVTLLMRLLDHSFIKLLMGPDSASHPGPEGFTKLDIVTLSHLLPSEPANVVMSRLEHALLLEYLLAQITWMGEHEQSILADIPLTQITGKLRAIRHVLSTNTTDIRFHLWKRY